MRPKAVRRREKSVVGINGKMCDITEEVGERQGKRMSWTKSNSSVMVKIRGFLHVQGLLPQLEDRQRL